MLVNKNIIVFTNGFRIGIQHTHKSAVTEVIMVQAFGAKTGN